MSKNGPHSQRLKDLLKTIKNSGNNDYDYNDEEVTPYRLINSHTLYQEVAGKIAAEQDIYIVKEIALHYLNNICASVPDVAATEIARRIDGV